MHVFLSGTGMLPIMQTGTGPQSSATGAPSFENPEFRGVHEDVLTIGEIMKRVEARGEKPPLMLMINSTTDYHPVGGGEPAMARRSALNPRARRRR